MFLGDAGATVAENPGCSRNLTRTHPLLLCCSNLATSARTKPPGARKPLPHCSTATAPRWQCSWPRSQHSKQTGAGKKHGGLHESSATTDQLNLKAYSKLPLRVTSISSFYWYLSQEMTLSQFFFLFSVPLFVRQQIIWWPFVTHFQ